MRYHYPLTALIQGKALAARGEIMTNHPEPVGRPSSAWDGVRPAALQAFEQAEAEAMDLGMRPLIWQARLGASQALAGMGKASQAQQERASAIRMVEEIAGLFDDETLRQAYLQSTLDKVKTL